MPRSSIAIRQIWRQTLIVNQPGRSREHVGSDVTTGLADLEAYGQMVLSNPDFVERLKANAPMNEADRNTYFSGGSHGYTDYLALNQALPT